MMFVEYVNARVHGMSSHLIQVHGFERLIAQTSVEGIINELEKTPYRDDIVEGKAIYPGMSCLEYALQKNLAKTYNKIFGLVKEEKPARYITIFLKKWDVQNIKTILRGKNIQAPSEEILSCIVPAGTLDETTLLELVKQPDVRAVVDLMATWKIGYALPLTRHIGEFFERRETALLEFALDEYYYSQALEVLKGHSEDDRIVRTFIGTEIDVRNLKTSLVMRRDNVTTEDARRYLLKGGKELKPGFFTEFLQAKTIQDALDLLEPTSYGFLSSRRNDYPVKLSDLEKDLDHFLTRKGIGMFRGDPFSFTVTIGYLYAKLNEITNIRIIARCRESGMPDEIMESEVFYV